MIDRLHIDRVRSGFASEQVTDVAPQCCCQCGGQIPPGMFFTRRIITATEAIRIVCERCQPFRLVDLPMMVDHHPTRPLGA